jgi:competence protein ComEA
VEIDSYISQEIGENIIDQDIKITNNLVNINTATQNELETLAGIGPSTALKIINYREENGKFKKIEDIRNVPGIGEAKFNAIKKQICV